MNDVSHACLVIAIAAVGLKTSLYDIKKVGPRVMVLLVTEAVFLGGFVLILQIMQRVQDAFQHDRRNSM